MRPKILILFIVALLLFLVGCDRTYDRLSRAAPGDTLYYRHGHSVTFGVVLHNIPKERVIIVNHRNIFNYSIVSEEIFSYDDIVLTSLGGK